MNGAALAALFFACTSALLMLADFVCAPYLFSRVQHLALQHI